MAVKNPEFVFRQRIDGERPVDRFGSYSIEVNGEVLVGETYELVDLNGNGYRDLIVGAGFGNPDNVEDAGSVYIFFNDGTGRFDGQEILSAADADLRIDGEEIFDFFGAAVGVGDINGDGHPDLVIGAPGVNIGVQASVGRVYVFFNDGTGGFITDPAVADVRIDGENPEDNFGSSLIVTEFDTDAGPDLAVGAPFYDVNGITNAGRVYIFLNTGAPDYFPASAADADGTIDGQQVDESFGIHLLAADIDGDTFNDLLVGSPIANPHPGKVYLFMNDGTGQFPATTTDANETIVGEQEGMGFGTCIEAGDLNGNGNNDLIVGAPEFDSPVGTNAGALFVFHNDGTTPFFPPSSANANQRIDAESAGDRFGQACFISAPTQGDLLVSSPRFNVPVNGILENAGAVYLFENDGTGVFPTNAADATLRFDGTAAGIRFGSGVKTADLTADALYDLVIGARLASFTGGEDSGSIFIFVQEEVPIIRVPRCEKVKLDRILCDEIFYLQDLEENVPIGDVAVPEGSTIGGTVTVTVLNCTPVLFEEQIAAELQLMIQKELVITTPDQEEIPLEFGFHLGRTVTFRKCEDFDPTLIPESRCHIVFISGMDEVELTPSTVDPDTGAILQQATFTEDLIIQVKIKIVQEVQEFVALCPPSHQMEIEIGE